MNLVFLHGWGLHSEMWNAQKKYFSNYNVYTPDILGFGKNTQYEGELTPDIMVEDLVSRLPSSYVLIGYSLGGLLAQILASKYPYKVQQCILVSSFYSKNKTAYDQIKNYLAWNALSISGKHFLLQSMKLFGHTHDHIYNIVKENSDATLLKSFWPIMNYSAPLHISCPVHIIHGISDVVIGPEHAHYLKLKYPFSSLQYIAGHGHGLPFTYTDLNKDIHTKIRQYTYH